MTILTAAGQHNHSHKQHFCFCSKFHRSQKKPNPKPYQGLHITHQKGLLEVCYLPSNQASIQKQFQEHRNQRRLLSYGFMPVINGLCV